MKVVSSNAGIHERRVVLRAFASAAGVALIGCATARVASPGAQPSNGDEKHDEPEVTPGEDLMQEHGVLEPDSLVYDEAAQRIEKNEPLELPVLTRAAGLVRSFVEDYHERLEEQFVFPRLQRAGRETKLVSVLLRQHELGRQLTDDILRRAEGRGNTELAQALRSFARMYRPHAAREDTVLFPAFRVVVGSSGYPELGERFEEQEHRQFGDHGFERVVAQVAELELALGIHDFSNFTPPVIDRTSRLPPRSG
ncbi:MAG: hemerythrin domain-containing protein [Polyangiaceae bacterium]